MWEEDPFEKFFKAFFELNKGFMEPYKRETKISREVREPLMDVVDEGDKIRVTVELPGVKKENIDIDVKPRMLSIKAKASKKTKKEEKNYYFAERSAEMFSRTTTLPAEVIPEKTSATYNNGILEIILKKKEPTKKKRGTVKIKVK